MLDYKTPGVIIEELPATGPIAGVGTSTVAFIGPALDGPITVPTKITNWTQYRNIFGEYQAAPRIYLPHAVRGFFDNGGSIAYIVRVGTAVRSSLELDDRGLAPGKALRVESKREGVEGDNIRVEIKNAQILGPGVATVQKTRAAVNAAPPGSRLQVTNPADAALFRPGDSITIEGTAERAQIDRIFGDQIFLFTPLAAAVAAGAFLRIADLVINQKLFRVKSPLGIEPGSVVHLDNAANNEDVVVDSITGEFITIAGSGLTKTYGLLAANPAVNVTTLEFSLTVSRIVAPLVTEPFDNLSMDPRHSRYFARVVISPLAGAPAIPGWSGVTVSLPAVPGVQPPPNNRPAVTVGVKNLAGGANDNLAAIGPIHYTAALTALERVDDVSLVAAPASSETIQTSVVAHCEKMADRFAILDSTVNALPVAPAGSPSVVTQRAKLLSSRGYAALYYPWIIITDPLSRTGEETVPVPPSGHVAGIYGRSDTQRGVHKAPANEYITGALDLERILTDAEQGELNVEGIDCLRIFPGQRPIVWGARTTAPKEETPWRYVNVRRLFLFIEESIQEGIRWAVFEPNDRTLWKKLDRTIAEFLTRVWRSGALFGKTAAEAFYVKIDDELNPPSTRALGQVIIEIGVAPVRPAEFVVVRIAMFDGGSAANE